MLQKLKNKLHFWESAGMSWKFGFPGRKMVVIGVTGTDGKTTTATLIHHILTVAGIKACLSSTLASPHTTTHSQRHQFTLSEVEGLGLSASLMFRARDFCSPLASTNL